MQIYVLLRLGCYTLLSVVEASSTRGVDPKLHTTPSRMAWSAPTALVASGRLETPDTQYLPGSPSGCSSVTDPEPRGRK